MSALEVVLAVLAALTGIGGTLFATVIRGLALDEAKGRIQKWVSEDVEATIASLPPELQADWAEEWRAERDALTKMPVSAVIWARGLRHSARELIAESAVAPVSTDSGTASPQRKTLKNAAQRIVQILTRPSRGPRSVRPSTTGSESVLDTRLIAIVSVASLLGAVVGSALGGTVMGTVIAAAILPFITAFLTHPGPHRLRRIGVVLVLAALIAGLRDDPVATLMLLAILTSILAFSARVREASKRRRMRR